MWATVQNLYITWTMSHTGWLMGILISWLNTLNNQVFCSMAACVPCRELTAIPYLNKGTFESMIFRTSRLVKHVSFLEGIFCWGKRPVSLFHCISKLKASLNETWIWRTWQKNWQLQKRKTCNKTCRVKSCFRHPHPWSWRSVITLLGCPRKLGSMVRISGL